MAQGPILCKRDEHAHGIFSIPNIDGVSFYSHSILAFIKRLLLPPTTKLYALVGAKVLLCWLFLWPANVHTFTDFGDCEVITQALAFTIRDD